MPERLLESPLAEEVENHLDALERAVRRLRDSAEMERLERALEDLRESARAAGVREKALLAALDESEHARECLEESLAGRMRVLHLIAHEVGTPLNALQLQLQLLAKEPVPARTLQLIRMTQEAWRELLTLKDSLLDFSRGEELRRTMQPSRFQVDGLLRDLAASIRPVAEKKGLEVHLAAESMDPLETDRRLLRVVMRNLLDNALKYTEAGVITLSAGRTGDEIRLRVSDTGPGMDPEDLDRIFEPFQRLGGSKARGSGLGLALAKDLAETLGGRIEVESEVGVGSTFSLVLPAAGWRPAPPSC